ncbi:hypothetical protein WMF37_08820 [Sorangium sp. So ce291]|uniref:hypothetical protein n=1 Tax=Sorangium sp. So ce291 TaxID=3133294 RepID=UPI003F5EE8C0
MYFWNIKALRAALAHGTLSEQARFIYLLTLVFLTAALLEIAAALPGAAANPSPTNEWDWLQSAITIASTVLGTVWAYHLNGGSHGRHFLERYVALTWVYSLRFMVIVMLPVWTLAYTAATLLELTTDATGPFDVALWSAMDVAYLIGFFRQIRLTAAAEPAAQRGALAGATQHP